MIKNAIRRRAGRIKPAINEPGAPEAGGPAGLPSELPQGQPIDPRLTRGQDRLRAEEAPPSVTAQPAGSPAANIRELGTANVPPGKSNIHCLPIIGQIEGHLLLPPQNKTTKYEHIIPQLVAIENSSDIQGVLMIMNTVGGDVEAGLALAEMVASMSKPVVSLVLGGGHSIGVPIAVAARRSFIAPTATMTVHPIRLTGLVVGVPQTYDYLDKMQDRLVRFVVEHSRISNERYRELMFRTGELARDIGTVLVGQDAVRAGLIDETGGLKEALASLEAMIDEAKSAPGEGPGPVEHGAPSHTVTGQAAPAGDGAEKAKRVRARGGRRKE